MKKLLFFLSLVVSLSVNAQYTLTSADSISFIFNGVRLYRNYGVAYGTSSIYIREIGTGFNLSQPSTPQSYTINGVFYRNRDSCAKALLGVVTPYGAAGQVLWIDTLPGAPIATKAYVNAHGGSGGTPSGHNRWVQFNNNSSFGADTFLRYYDSAGAANLVVGNTDSTKSGYGAVQTNNLFLSNPNGTGTFLSANGTANGVYPIAFPPNNGSATNIFSTDGSGTTKWSNIGVLPVNDTVIVPTTSIFVCARRQTRVILSSSLVATSQIILPLAEIDGQSLMITTDGAGGVTSLSCSTSDGTNVSPSILNLDIEAGKTLQYTVVFHLVTYTWY